MWDIWQLKDTEDLEICWRELPSEDPRNEESRLIGEFETQFEALPFANLTH